MRLFLVGLMLVGLIGCSKPATTKKPDKPTTPAKAKCDKCKKDPCVCKKEEVKKTVEEVKKAVEGDTK